MPLPKVHCKHLRLFLYRKEAEDSHVKHFEISRWNLVAQCGYQCRHQEMNNQNFVLIQCGSYHLLIFFYLDAWKIRFN